MTKQERTYWKDCVKPDMYDSFIENVVIKITGKLINGLQDFSIKLTNDLEIYVPAEDIKEYIERKNR